MLVGIYITCTLNHILGICTWGMGKNSLDNGHSNSHKHQLRREGECLYHCTLFLMLSCFPTNKNVLVNYPINLSKA